LIDIKNLVSPKIQITCIVLQISIIKADEYAQQNHAEGAFETKYGFENSHSGEAPWSVHYKDYTFSRRKGQESFDI
jgi:hypothetical protein